MRPNGHASRHKLLKPVSVQPSPRVHTKENNSATTDQIREKLTPTCVVVLNAMQVRQVLTKWKYK